jgi:hypothetical protein
LLPNKSNNMAEEGQTITQTAPTESQNETRSNERITQLSEKVKVEAEARAAAEQKAAEAERKAAFAEGYADFALKNPVAKDFKQQIQEKVMAGMSVEDAGYAILGREGKLGASPTQSIVQSPAGGSATTYVPAEGQKTIGQMTQQERRAALAERAGELEDILAPRARA